MFGLLHALDPTGLCNYGELVAIQLPSMVRHLLLLQFKQNAGQDRIDAMFSQFVGLKVRIDGIESIEYGTNQSPENLNKNFTHSVLVTFSDVLARDRYLVHPDHKDLEGVLLELLADLIVFDLES